MIRHQSKYDRGVPGLHFSKAADEWWKEKHAWLFGQRWDTCGIHFVQTYPFPKLLVMIQ